ncbi:hypothetical protein EJP77_12205 [Paenibacillus zeisoli]|uniref:Uncharacterized protein n=1 Tax=Paenibacillus zeisoli TaxID=2496267 RepID=A0A433X972_9BACL|nr:hypothetical protein [Paenibacillus zeisoli]RUT30583.1 hypothetical protein EJP77_12205 [Paenibacillus zeisoli]
MDRDRNLMNPDNRGDQEYEQYKILADYDPENDIPSNDLLPHDSRTTQSVSSSEEDETDSYVDAAEDAPLVDVPDADAIQENSPVDPAAPPEIIMHGTDLINGYDGGDEE